MFVTIFDIEADGLLKAEGDKRAATVIHCLSYKGYVDGEVVSQGSITDYEEMRQFIFAQETLVGHNIIRYDIPMLEKFLEIKIINPVIDTLGISYYLYPNRAKHGLESWGEELGVKKIDIQDWQGLSLAQYIHRCETDVIINTRLYIAQEAYLSLLYNNPLRLIRYLNFKLSCLLDQEMEGIPIDVASCLAAKTVLEKVVADKIEKLQQVMPLKFGKIIRSKPKQRTTDWDRYLKERNLPPDITEVRELPNPTSSPQLKAWLDSMGWKPITFKFSKQTKKNVPQISLPFGQGLCSSVKDLYAIEPTLVELDGLFVAQHRLGLIDGFLESRDEENKIYASAHGFTNTLRLQHSKPVVNLPNITKPYGKEVRGALVIPNEDYIMCGADISGLEDNTKQHYIYNYDPKYVTEMRVPGFDPHIDIAVVGKMITEDDAEFFKAFDHCPNPSEVYTMEDAVRYKKIKKIRQDAKVVNFSATYGAGPPKIAEVLKKSVEEAKVLHTTYWKRNKAVKLTANACKIATVRGQKWLYNPISGFWMFLKADKDRFSTLNQSSGVYVFDSWLRKVREKIAPVKVIMQYHDELLLICKKQDKEFIENCLQEAMRETNEEVHLNVSIGISTSWGDNYADCH